MILVPRYRKVEPCTAAQPRAIERALGQRDPFKREAMLFAFQQGGLGRVKKPGVAGGSDPNFANVILLLHGDGTNGGTTFTDSSSFGRAATANGNVQTATDANAFGGSSILCDGSGDYLVFAASGATYNPGEEFTIEFWVEFNSVSGSPGLVDYRPGSSTVGTLVYLTGAKMSFYKGSANATISGATTIVTATRYHVALCYKSSVVSAGTVWELYLNGALEASSSTNDTTMGNYQTTVGAFANGSNGLNGKIEEVRITKGVRRYTSAFTPPTAAFPNS